MKREVLGVKIDDVNIDEALKRSLLFLKGDSLAKPFLVFTTGPEFLVTAQKDLEFKKILNSADLNIPDGIGLKLFCGFKNSFAGVDLMLDLCKVAAEKKLTVGLFGGKTGVAKKTKTVLEQEYPGLKIIYAIDGYVNEPHEPVDILFVGLGHPKQEKFLYSLKEDPIGSPAGGLQGDTFRMGMGVGGSFDFISGNLPRPPEVIRKLGLGWLYRGFTKPGHWKRIFKAVVVFPFDLLFYSLIQKTP